MNIGENIKTIRIKKGVTQKELSKKTGISEISIRKYENENRKPKIENLNKIANALNIGLYELIPSDDEELNKEFVFFDSKEEMLMLLKEIKECDNPTIQDLADSILDTARNTVHHIMREKNITKLRYILMHYENLHTSLKLFDNAIEEYTINEFRREEEKDIEEMKKMREVLLESLKKSKEGE